jgi:hypothetical protein
MEQEMGVAVRIEAGGLGEISVHHEGKQLYDGPRLWYPTPGSVVRHVREALTKDEETEA